MSSDQDLRQRFIGGMSFAASTVNIVTTDGPAGRAGVTVSAMSSVSADSPKPTLLVCVHEASAAAAKILENGVFCVNVLRDDQSYISDTFAGRFKDQVKDKFDCANWSDMPTGCPRVVDPLVGFDCTVLTSDKVGTHYVFFGEVSEIFLGPKGSPLIYANRAYGSTLRFDSAERQNGATTQRLSIGCFHTFGPSIMPKMISHMAKNNPDLVINLVEGDQRRIQESLLCGETEVALLYDLDIASELETVELTYLPAYVLLPENHPLASKTSLTPADLAPHPMVLLNAAPSRDYFADIMEQAGVTPHIAYRSTSLEMVRGLVGQGLGYAVLATQPAADQSYDGKPLITRPLLAETGPGRVVLAIRKGAELSKPAREFLWFCRDFFALNA